ncbi:uncharacterized protein TNIN_442381 [Trichonephila inaurata madagascariensis]|uniref:Uncharacterized protein n=1 Tax=Trichonephila inaurata madagascariensis TaxID=2747483 RepID=A0A8X6XYE2_9ARAC|nr:uncharacterized protein TNIN_442381 [Trichonephila inaurata madagascariensis]
MEGQRRCLGCKIVLAVLGVVSGASIFVSFIYYKNYNAAIWGLLTGIFAAVVLRLHISYRRRVLHLKHTADSLQIVKVCGLILSFTAITASIVYFILAAVGHQGYKIEDDGYAPAGIFALLSLKWTVMMFFEGRKYEKLLRSTGVEEAAPTSYNSVESGIVD